MSETTAKKSYFWQYLVPAFLSLAIVFAIVFYFHTRPSYSAKVFNMDHLLWEISGNDSSIKITSINGESEQSDKPLYLWVKKVNQDKPFRVGLLPIKNGSSSRYPLPTDLNIGVGDEAILSDASDNLLASPNGLVITLSDAQ